MGDNDCNGNVGDVSGLVPFGKNPPDTEGQSSIKERLDGGDCDGSAVISHAGFEGSTASLTASSECVCFIGDDSRLELFPVDQLGRAIASRPIQIPSMRQEIVQHIDLCRNRCSIDIMYVCVLSLLSIVIILVLILDN